VAALFLARLAYAATSIIPFVFLYFSTIFPRGKIESSNKWLWLVIPPVFVAALSFTPGIVESIERASYGVNIITGKYYLVFGIVFLAYMGTSFINIWKKRRISTGLEKIQIQYVLIGTLIATTGGAIFDLFLPYITGTFAYSKYGPYFTIFLMGFTTYAIVKHRLFNINKLFARGLIFLLLIFFASLAFVRQSSGRCNRR
jgi:hypothetical protein